MVLMQSASLLIVTVAKDLSPVSIQTQRTQRKRLRLDGNRALLSFYLKYIVTV